METEDSFRKFTQSGQAAVKLEIALEQAFREDLPASCRRAYRDYLRLRIRPAMEACIHREDTLLLDRMEAQGWMEGIGLDDLIRLAGDSRKNAALIWLLRRKQRVFGFQKPDFSL